MVRLEKITEEVQKTAPLYNIKSVRLFGSYAKGKATDDSDVDLLVELDPDDNSYGNFFGFQEHMKCNLKMKVDVLEYPIEKKRLFSKSFKTGKVVKIYG